MGTVQKAANSPKGGAGVVSKALTSLTVEREEKREMWGSSGTDCLAPG